MLLTVLRFTIARVNASAADQEQVDVGCGWVGYVGVAGGCFGAGTAPNYVPQVLTT